MNFKHKDVIYNIEYELTAELHEGEPYLDYVFIITDTNDKIIRTYHRRVFVIVDNKYITNLTGEMMNRFIRELGGVSVMDNKRVAEFLWEYYHVLEGHLHRIESDMLDNHTAWHDKMHKELDDEMFEVTQAIEFITGEEIKHY